MRNIHIPGRSNILGANGMAATSQPLSTLEAISILKKGGLDMDIASKTLYIFDRYNIIFSI